MRNTQARTPHPAEKKAGYQLHLNFENGLTVKRFLFVSQRVHESAHMTEDLAANIFWGIGIRLGLTVP